MALPSIARISSGLARSSASLCRSMGTAATSPATAESKPKKKAMATFDWTDALNLESRLTEEEIAVRDVSRDYCQGTVQSCNSSCSYISHINLVFCFAICHNC